MNCKKCGNLLSEDASFCGKCGTSTAELDTTLTTVVAVEKETVEEIKPKKKKTKLIIFLLSFMLILGILTGSWGGYYIAKNGWEVVPFVEKLSFLPFIKLDKKIIETYSDQIDEEDLEDIDEKDMLTDESIDDDLDDQATDMEPPDTLEELLFVGDWVGSHPQGNIIIRLKENGVASVFSENVVYDGQNILVESFIKEFAIDGNLLKLGEEDFGKFNFAENKLVMLEESITLRKTVIPSSTLVGSWMHTGDDINSFLEFEEDLLGLKAVFFEESAEYVKLEYSCESELGIITLIQEGTDDIDIITLYAEIIGDYLLLSDQDDHEKEVIIFKKTIGGN